MFIYLITNLVNGKYYVGQTARSVQERFSGHCLHSRQGSAMRIHAAMRKHGTSNFIVEQLACAEEQKQTDLLERLWIASLDSRNFSVGYNASPGGDARSKESAAKASAKMRGVLNPNFGKTMSEEQRLKISASRKNKGTGKRPESVCRKIAATRRAKIASGEIKMPEGGKTYWLGKSKSEASKRKCSVTLSCKYVGERSSMYKRVHTEETRAKMRASHAARKEKTNG